MKASVYVGNQKVEIQELEKPEIGLDEVLLKVSACGVCGTDIGKVMHDQGKPPVVLGHEVAGWVEAVGANVEKFKVGDRVVVAHHTPCYACHYCKHGNISMCKAFKKSNLDPGGFAQFLRIPSVHVQMTAHKIPESVHFEEAVFMEPLACILRNIKRAKLQQGDTVLIVGLGSVGLMTGQALINQGIQVVGSDLKKERCELAIEMGFDFSTQAQHQEIMQSLSRLTQDRGADAVILTAGNSSVYSSVLNYIRDGGKVSIFAGLEPGAKIEYDANEIFKREITIFSSYSPSPIELKEALDLIEQKKVNVKKLNAKKYSLENISSAIQSVAKQEIFKAIVDPSI